MTNGGPTNAAHNSGWETSEVVFGAAFLAAVALQFLVPWSLPREGLVLVFAVLGAALAILGVALISQTRRELARHDQPTSPGLPTSQIVTTGVFSFSRNPFYLGATSLLAGVALGINLPWLLVMLVPALVACHYVLIAPEERYLAAKFGQEYHAYTATVRRWIGRKR